METLVNQRVNFFLIFFSAVLAASLGVTEISHARLILTLGAVITLLMYVTILRSQQKLTLCFRYLSRDRTHPVRIIDRAAGPPSVRRLLSAVVPAICCGVLLVGAAAAWLDRFPLRARAGDDVKATLAAFAAEYRTVVAENARIKERMSSLEERTRDFEQQHQMLLERLAAVERPRTVLADKVPSEKR